MNDIANNAKITLMWRGLVGVLGVLTTAIVGTIFAYVKSADGKLNTVTNDVALIKWELPVIKKTQEADKAEILRQIAAMEQRIQAIRELRDTDSREISDLKTTVALLKQKLEHTQ